MAPVSLEHFIMLAQQGQLPQFEGVPPTPVIPGLAASRKQMLFYFIQRRQTDRDKGLSLSEGPS